MERFADAFATLFTFLLFLFIILAPMLMAFLREKNAEKRKAGEKKKRSSSKKEFSLFDLLRREDRISERRVEFTGPKTGWKMRSDGKEYPAGRALPGRMTEEKAGTTQVHFDELGEAFEKPLTEKFEEIGAALKETATPVAPAQSRISSRVQHLPELKRAVVMAEILGPPKGLDH